MPLDQGQISVRDLVMGADTRYEIVTFQPWTREVRAPSQEDRVHGHGAVSGAEWYAPVVVSMQLGINGQPGEDCPTDASFDNWIARRDDLAYAFRPIEDDIEEIELRFRFGSTEYLYFGRPRLTEPPQDWISWVTHAEGTTVECEFFVTDGIRYSGEEFTDDVGVVKFTGGLIVPSPPSVTLNSNSGFEDGVSDWFVNGGDREQSTDEAFRDAASMLVTPDGATATVEAGAADVRVGEERRYRWSMWVLSPDGYDGLRLRIVWRDSGGSDIGSSFSDSTEAPEGEWTKLSLDVVSPTGAVGASPRLQITDSPAATDTLYIDEAHFQHESSGIMTAPITPTGAGGLISPATSFDGVLELTNEGTFPVGIIIDVHGFVDTARLSLEHPDGTAQSMTVNTTIPSGQFVEIDTRARQALLNGNPAQSVTSDVEGDWLMLPEGTSTFRFHASDAGPNARAEVRYRHAWY